MRKREGRGGGGGAASGFTDTAVHEMCCQMMPIVWSKKRSEVKRAPGSSPHAAAAPGSLLPLAPFLFLVLNGGTRRERHRTCWAGLPPVEAFHEDMRIRIRI